MAAHDESTSASLPSLCKARLSERDDLYCKLGLGDGVLDRYVVDDDGVPQPLPDWQTLSDLAQSIEKPTILIRETDVSYKVPLDMCKENNVLGTSTPTRKVAVGDRRAATTPAPDRSPLGAVSLNNDGAVRDHASKAPRCSDSPPVTGAVYGGHAGGSKRRRRKRRRQAQRSDSDSSSDGDETMIATTTTTATNTRRSGPSHKRNHDSKRVRTDDSEEAVDRQEDVRRASSYEQLCHLPRKRRHPEEANLQQQEKAPGLTPRLSCMLEAVDAPVSYVKKCEVYEELLSVARYGLLQVHVDNNIAASDRELGPLLTARTCVIQGFAPNAEKPILEESEDRKCKSMLPGEAFRSALPEESVRIDMLLDGVGGPASMWTSGDEPTAEQEEIMTRVAAIVLACEFDAVVVQGTPGKGAMMRALDQMEGREWKKVGQHYGYSDPSRVITVGSTTIFFSMHPQNLLPSWSMAVTARTYAKGYDAIVQYVRRVLGYAASESCAVFDFVVSLGGRTDIICGRDDPITMIRNLHDNSEIATGVELGWDELPPIVIEHLMAEGITCDDEWKAKNWRPSKAKALKKPPYSKLKYYLSSQGKASVKKDGDELERLLASGETLDEKSKKRSKFVPKKKRKVGMTAEEAMKAATDSNSSGGKTGGGNGLGTNKGANGAFGSGGAFYLFQVTCPDGSTHDFSKPFKKTHGMPAPASGTPPLTRFAVPAPLWRLAQKLVPNFKWDDSMMLNKINELPDFTVKCVAPITEEEHQLYRKCDSIVAMLALRDT